MRADLPPVAPVSKDCGPNEHWDTARQTCFLTLKKEKATLVRVRETVETKDYSKGKARMGERENATY